MITLKIEELLEKKNYFQLKNLLNDMTSFDVAEILENDNKNILLLFRMLKKEFAAEVFSHLSSDDQIQIVDSISDKNLQEILNELFFDDMIDFIEEMPSTIVKRVLKNSSDKNRVLINQFLSYPKDSAGSLMTTEYLSVKKEWSVKETLDYIRTYGAQSETVETSYVINERKELIGIVTLKSLLFSKDSDKIIDIMDDAISINTLADREISIELFKKYDFLVLPVVDNENKLLGIITIDDVVDAIEEENTEDFHKMAAMTPSKEEYLDSGVFSLAKNRLLWLLVLMVSATFTGSIISKYEDVLQSMVILAASIPMLMDTGGNAGSQSSTLIIRGIALGEIEIKDYLSVLWKEFRVSLIVGFGLGSLNFLRMVYLIKVSVHVSIVVSVTLVFTIIAAKLVGGLLPLGAKKLNLDPAIMAGPLVTTVVDALALFIYFHLAKIILHL
ncbi:MAG: magnesium transporter [Fusobacteriaceae bacterium]